MKKKNKLNNFVLIGILYFVILLTISTAYSFFNTNLSMQGTVGISASNENYETSYIKQAEWDDGSIYNYHFIATLTYLGTEPTTGWKLYIKVPYDTEIIGCYNADSCVVEGETLTITNATTNGVLTTNSNSVSPSFQMKTSDGNYEFKVIGASFTTESTGGGGESGGESGGNTDGETPDTPEDDFVEIDYINANLKITGGWGKTSTYIFKASNKSISNRVSSWSADIYFPPQTTINSIWGGTYNYDSATGLLTIHGAAWAPGILPLGFDEVNIFATTPYSSPYTPTVGKFTAVTSTGEKIQTSITIEGGS